MPLISICQWDDGLLPASVRQYGRTAYRFDRQAVFQEYSGANTFYEDDGLYYRSHEICPAVRTDRISITVLIDRTKQLTFNAGKNDSHRGGIPSRSIRDDRWARIPGLSQCHGHHEHRPIFNFYALFAANLVSHNSVFCIDPKTQNAHGGRNVMPRCLSEGVDIFLKSVKRQGKADTMSASADCRHGCRL